MTSSDLHDFWEIGVKRTREAPCSKALTPSRLPGLDLTLNPYRGCAHGCIYCYAPSLLHLSAKEWSDPLPKRGFIRLLERELPHIKGVIGVGTSTDPYQPMEADLCLTRRALELISKNGLRFCIHTKSDLVTRDIDLIGPNEVGVTVTSLDEVVSRVIEPGAPPPSRRLDALLLLNDAGIHTFVMVGPALSCIEGREEELVGAIAATGTEVLMVDTLRLRPNTGSELADAGVRAAGQATMRRLKLFAKEMGLDYRTAF